MPMFRITIIVTVRINGRLKKNWAERQSKVCRQLDLAAKNSIVEKHELQKNSGPDPDNGTITITVVMVLLLIDCLGTIAQSGTSKFLAALKESKDVGADNALIGQFGLGFYSAFLVSEKVVVSAKSPKSDKQYIWEAAAESSKYMIKEETDPEKMLRRGTQITLYLRSDHKYEYTEPTKIQNLNRGVLDYLCYSAAAAACRTRFAAAV
uniref:Histidine kinase/HSP90-like ATPase domain-containing protein n=1 Tax=Daucus carota subsp. sativus TaxID=79200 RepID=A0A166CRR2_DAUCS